MADISNIAMAVADFPRGMFSKKDSKSSGESKDSKESDSHPASSRKLSDLVSSTRTNNDSRGTLPTVSSTSTTQGSVEPPAGIAELPSDNVASPPVLAEEPQEVDPGHGAGPSVTVTSDEPHRSRSVATFDSQVAHHGSDNLSQEHLPGPSSPSHSRTASHSRAGSHSRTPSQTESPHQNFDLEDLRGAGTSVRKIVTTGMKSPMNFCLNLAKGFRNVPRLYNDDTVRPPEKVTDMTSGLKVAGREFGYGMYDGISGLVTQPFKGAQKQGGVGLVKGFGRGIGGAFTKPFGGECCDSLFISSH